MNIDCSESSNLKSANWNEETQELNVVFENGAAYRYPRVAPEVAHAFAIAPSKGKYFHRVIKPVSKANQTIAQPPTEET